jgi:hypothetical protein
MFPVMFKATEAQVGEVNPVIPQEVDQPVQTQFVPGVAVDVGVDVGAGDVVWEQEVV